MKSTVDDIRARFDKDVERFSNLQTGQSATIDAPLALELIAEAAAATTPRATRLLDIGCGAGNYTLKLLDVLPRLDVALIDLSRPMLERAVERLEAAGVDDLLSLHGDVRELELGEGHFDIKFAPGLVRCPGQSRAALQLHDTPSHGGFEATPVGRPEMFGDDQVDIVAECLRGAVTEQGGGGLDFMVAHAVLPRKGQPMSPCFPCFGRITPGFCSNASDERPGAPLAQTIKCLALPG